MIATERQLQRAQAGLAQLREALTSEQAETDIAPELARAALAGIQSQVDELEASIAQYEALRDGTLATIKFASLLEVPNVLIAARLTSGLNQSQLAECLEVSSQQVQKDEAGDYGKASLERLHTAAAILNVRIDGVAQLPARGSVRPVPSREELMGLQPVGSAATST